MIRTLFLTFIYVLSTPVFAVGLPTVAAPSRGGVATGDYLGLFQEYAADIALLLGLILTTVSFLVVARNAIHIYAEIGNGQKTWKDMAAQGAVGVFLLLFNIFLLREGLTIL